MSRKLILPSAFALMAAAVLFAGDGAKKDSSSAHRTPDHLMATCVALGNQEEVAISEVARKKSENDEVKKFAEMMIMDHHAFLEKLQKYAPEATKADYLGNDPKTAAADEKEPTKSETRAVIRQTAAADDKNDNDVKTADSAATDAGHEHFNHMKLERELATECLNAAKAKLNDKSGAEFDKCFMGFQLAMHMGMKNKLVVFQRHASSDLASILAEGQKKTEEHLAKAESIMKDLEQHSTTTIIEKNRDGGKKDKRVIKEKAND